MASLLTTLAGSLLSGSGTQSLAKTSGASDDQVKSLVSSALPVLLQSMANNATDDKGAQSLAKALDAHAEKATSVETADTEDGAKILNHVLGDKNDKVQSTLAKSTGMTAEQVGTVLASLAPVVMSMVGQEKKKAEKTAEKSNSTDLAGMLTGLVTGTSSGKDEKGGLDLGSILSFAQQDNDGDGKSDVLSTLTKLVTGK